MIKPFAFRALSPHHATAMDLDYLLRVVEAARKYGFNALQICGDTHAEGRCEIELRAIEPENSPYLREVRLETETTAEPA